MQQQVTPNKGLRNAMESFLAALDRDDDAKVQLWGETIATVCRAKNIDVVALWNSYFRK